MNLDSNEVVEHRFGLAGQKYGMLEVKVILSTLIRHFRFSVTEESKRIVIPCNEIVLKPKTTMPLVITRRNPL